MSEDYDGHYNEEHRCYGITRTGRPCRAHAWDGYCAIHRGQDPQREDEPEAASGAPEEILFPPDDLDEGEVNQLENEFIRDVARVLMEKAALLPASSDVARRFEHTAERLTHNLASDIQGGSR